MCRCNKVVYFTREPARRARRQINDKGLRVYSCPEKVGFHLGHPPPANIRGVISKDSGDWGRFRKHQVRLGSSPLVRERLLSLELDGVLAEMGPLMAATIARLTVSLSANPTWSQAWKELPKDLLRLIEEPDCDWRRGRDIWRKQAKELTMRRLRRAGWIYFDGRAHSLRPGRLFDGY